MNEPNKKELIRYFNLFDNFFKEKNLAPEKDFSFKKEFEKFYGIHVFPIEKFKYRYYSEDVEKGKKGRSNLVEIISEFGEEKINSDHLDYQEVREGYQLLKKWYSAPYLLGSLIGLVKKDTSKIEGFVDFENFSEAAKHVDTIYKKFYIPNLIKKGFNSSKE